MIPLELAGEFLYDKNFKIFSSINHWIEDFKVTSVTIRNFGYDELVFRCEYWDCGLLQSANVTAPLSQFNSWLEERREKQITQLV